MSWYFYRITYPIARKEYDDQGWEHISNSRRDFSFSDLRKIVKIKKKNYRILKGEKHIKITGKYEGMMDTFRISFDADFICNKYDLYEC